MNLLNLITKDTPSATLVIVKYDNFPDFDKKIRVLVSYRFKVACILKNIFFNDSLPPLSTLYRQGARHCTGLNCQTSQTNDKLKNVS